MGSFSLVHWLIVIGIAVLLFGGRGKLSSIMGDFAKGIKAFKSGMKEDDTAASAPDGQAQVTQAGTAPRAAVDARPGERV
ncbi:MAG: twin-arginine translocase TatA/TatE family subunit [Alphaproteobacteria bacterium]|nr:twin-arginine translocase TatA/TatE family subunit [Alphaproteobacteria bacterium]